MKPAIKKLKTCAYSKDLVASAALFRQSEPHTNKLTCDHPEMKLNWSEKVCGPCTVYTNRNAELVVPPPQPPQPVPPTKAATPAPPKKPAPAITSPVIPPVPAVPAKIADTQKTAPVPASKPAAREPAPVVPPAKAAPKTKASCKRKRRPRPAQKRTARPSRKPKPPKNNPRNPQEGCDKAEEKVGFGGYRILPPQDLAVVRHSGQAERERESISLVRSRSAGFPPRLTSRRRDIPSREWRPTPSNQDWAA